jgi:hypothetical protein
LHAGAVPGAPRAATESTAQTFADPVRLRVLRDEVGRLRQRETRRRFDPSIHVGRLGAEGTGCVIAARDLPVVDVELRIDVMERLLSEAPQHWCTAWLIRPGTVEQHDTDLRWFSAVRTAFEMHGRQLDGFYAVTRWGWRDVLSGESRTWVRLRL